MTDRDIVERLRSWSGKRPNTPAGECHEAADEIERLRAEVESLRAKRDAGLARRVADD